MYIERNECKGPARQESQPEPWACVFLLIYPLKLRFVGRIDLPPNAVRPVRLAAFCLRLVFGGNGLPFAAATPLSFPTDSPTSADGIARPNPPALCTVANQPGPIGRRSGAMGSWTTLNIGAAGRARLFGGHGPAQQQQSPRFAEARCCSRSCICLRSIAFGWLSPLLWGLFALDLFWIWLCLCSFVRFVCTPARSLFSFNPSH